MKTRREYAGQAIDALVATLRWVHRGDFRNGDEAHTLCIGSLIRAHIGTRRLVVTVAFYVELDEGSDLDPEDVCIDVDADAIAVTPLGAFHESIGSVVSYETVDVQEVCE
jgi:hypothetical protein